MADSEIDERAKAVVLTTGYTVAGVTIEKEIDVISAECVYGMNILKDFFASVRDVVGGRSGATQNVLRDARKIVLDELRSEAAALGADAVIGVDLDYQELNGGQKGGMIMLVASGTAVTTR